ncbi:MAG TPA: anti-sigma factor [Candidatus Cybelea sp.]
MSSHDEMLDAVAAYALGALPSREASAVVAHLRDCEECRAEYRLLQPAVTAVAYSAEACADPASGETVASPLLKARIMKQVRGEIRQPRAIRPWPAYVAAAACLALALVAGAFDLSLNGRLNRERAQVAEQNQTITDFMAPDSQRHPFAHGEVLMHGARLYIAMHDMPMPPRGKVYQAWTLAKGAKSVAPSKTFMPAATGMTVVRLPEAATTLAAVAVSVEPEGGSQQPTSKPIAMISLQ